MFEFVGAIARLPLGLLWIGFLFLTWPIGAGFLIVGHAFMLIITPFKFIGFAFARDKSGWESWKKDVFSDEFLSAFTYPFTETQKALNWIATGD